MQYKTPDEVYFGTCNSVNRGYIKLEEFYCKHPTPYGAIELEYKQGKYRLTKPAECFAEFEQSMDMEVIS